jgi:hypothetical protein
MTSSEVTAAGLRGSVRYTDPDGAGGYANCVMLHLLANRACGELFGGGETAAHMSSPC